jgi:hypothetical protein
MLQGHSVLDRRGKNMDNDTQENCIVKCIENHASGNRRRNIGEDESTIRDLKCTTFRF